MTVSTEIATPPKSTGSRISDLSVSRGTNSNCKSGRIGICTEGFQILDLIDFEGVALSVESVTLTCIYGEWTSEGSEE